MITAAQQVNQPATIFWLLLVPGFTIAGMTWIVLGIVKRKPYRDPRTNRAARRRTAFRKDQS